MGTETIEVSGHIVDSLLLVDFFLFLEKLAERDIPSETVTPERIATLRGAYELLSDHQPDKTS